MKHLILLIILLTLVGCASMLTTPLQDCRKLCADEKVELFKSDAQVCKCGSPELFTEDRSYDH